ncbi:glycosyltransferase family 2 protein [Vibrio methylphosphonaticus]|uniref:glycosyltransferase family 2 protein n=1 Tax=Vibrio methylphosphonaticus TaxID=2946866 RepID=UPI00202AB534|nr:glycosyltransferase family 2 protein [Vibrio methylphosphonaticus]MCL9774400.1 glycosyltransferase family 2 protein [Vibrio methylphosphonaticus]
MDGIWLGIFSICAALIIYHHAGYPLLLRWYSNKHPLKAVASLNRGYREQNKDRVLPSITILMPAFNEEMWIAEKIRNIASLDYPQNKLTVLIVCDGCTDNTVPLAEATIQEAICSQVHFEVISFEKNRGKVAILNQMLPGISSDLTAITDVSSLISIDALTIAASQFSDPEVGVVNSTYHLLDEESGEAAYWHYQNQIKYRETTLGSTIGSHGALYFIRTALFEPLPTNAINDDFLIPMTIVQHGYRAAYSSNMNAIELEATQAADDFKRRVRISAGNMQQVVELFDLFSPRFRGVAFAFVSGKGLRLLTPYLMIACLITSGLLSQYTLFLCFFIAQIAIYSLATVAYYLPILQRVKAIQLLTYLVVGHTANFIGGLRYLLGLENGKWKRILR